MLMIICQVLSHTIELTGNSIDCYFETLSIEDEMTITYQVSGGGHLDINFILYNPDQSTIIKHDHQNTGSHSFKATSNGIYKYCFDNSFSSITTKTISFNVHGIIYVEDDGHTAPIEKEIKALSQALEAVKDEQEYVVIRERLHRNSMFISRSSLLFF
jgi:hypothetical protein